MTRTTVIAEVGQRGVSVRLWPITEMRSSCARSYRSRDISAASIFLTFCSVLAVALLTFVAPTLAADVQCHFKTEGDTVDVKILASGKMVWSGTLRKKDAQTVNIPEGSFVLFSQVYNPNIDRKEEIRTVAHTNSCNHTMSLPLFSPIK